MTISSLNPRRALINSFGWEWNHSQPNACQILEGAQGRPGNTGYRETFLAGHRATSKAGKAKQEDNAQESQAQSRTGFRNAATRGAATGSGCADDGDGITSAVDVDRGPQSRVSTIEGIVGRGVPIAKPRRTQAGVNWETRVSRRNVNGVICAQITTGSGERRVHERRTVKDHATHASPGTCPVDGINQKSSRAIKGRVAWTENVVPIGILASQHDPVPEKTRRSASARDGARQRCVVRVTGPATRLGSRDQHIVRTGRHCAP